ncbi:MAG: ATP-binding protein [Bacteroidia bacterium]|nr:ATP-binding protein [Bacteroidia bacterium]
MSFVEYFSRLASYGVKDYYSPWEVHLVRKLNQSSLLGTLNVIFCLVVFVSMGYTGSVFECTVVLVVSPFMFFLNKWWGYVPAFYLFTFIGCFLFFFLSVKMGSDSFAFLYFFTLIIGIIQMGSRKEIFVHVVINVILCFITICLIALCYIYKVFQIVVPENMIEFCRYFNICFSFFTAAFFMLIISKESIRQEMLLQSALKQKEILLAELFHRVKNNLSIVTSLLNLKKDSAKSEETKDILEECRNHVFSMALVHTKMYNSNNLADLNFKEYLGELLPELINSIGGSPAVGFEIESSDVTMNLEQAIPCGLIVNELITNAFKHAQLPDQRLKIRVALKEENRWVYLDISDNGPGKCDVNNNKDSLGMELIRSLAEQLSAEYSFRNDDGLKFSLRFRK